MWRFGVRTACAMAILFASGHAGRAAPAERKTLQIGQAAPDFALPGIDGKTHRIRVYHDGKLVHDWPTGTGKRGLETYSGTYVVLGKAKEVVMDSMTRPRPRKTTNTRRSRRRRVRRERREPKPHFTARR